MATPPANSDRPQMEGDTAPLSIAREFMESLGMAAEEDAPDGNARGTRPLSDPIRVKRLLGHAVMQGERIVANIEPRVELLVAALQAGKAKIPGVSTWELRHPVTANGHNIIAYIDNRASNVQEFAQQVQVACYRYYELAQAVKRAKLALETDSYHDDMLEDLKLKTYFVTHFYDHFKDDVLMRQLFPAPIEPPKRGTGKPGGRTGPIGTDQISRYRQERDACGRRAEAFMRDLQPGLERPRKLLMLAKQDRGSVLMGLLNPGDMRERQLVKKLREQGRLAVIEEVVLQADKLQGLFTKVKDGGPYEPLEEALESINALLIAASKDDLLKDVLPARPAHIG